MDRGALRIDLRSESAIPAHEDVSALVDLVDDAAIARAQARVVARIVDELDPCSDCDSCTNPRRKESGTVRIHGANIGFGIEKLYPPRKVSKRRNAARTGEVEPRRRTAPNSTA